MFGFIYRRFESSWHTLKITPVPGVAQNDQQRVGFIYSRFESSRNALRITQNTTQNDQHYVLLYL